MKLDRVGANHNEGQKNIFDLEDISAEWCPKSKAILIKIKNQPAPSLKGRYDYTLNIKAKDVAILVKALSIDGINTSAPSIENSIGDISHELLRLLILSSGLALTPEPMDTRSKLQKNLQELLKARRAQ